MDIRLKDDRNDRMNTICSQNTIFYELRFLGLPSVRYTPVILSYEIW